MTVRFWLRAASAVTLLGTLLLLALALQHRVVAGSDEAFVVGTLKTHVYSSGGTRTYWQMYTGYAVFMLLAALLQAALCWDLAPLAVLAPRQTRPALMVLAVGNFACAVLGVRHFAWTFSALTAVIGCLLLGAWIAAHRLPARTTA